MFVQLRYELLNRPNSYLTNEVMTWYDSLYKESEKIETYDNNPILDLDLRKYDYSSIENFLFSVAKDITLKALKKLVNDQGKKL